MRVVNYAGSMISMYYSQYADWQFQVLHVRSTAHRKRNYFFYTAVREPAESAPRNPKFPGRSQPQLSPELHSTVTRPMERYSKPRLLSRIGVLIFLYYCRCRAFHVKSLDSISLPSLEASHDITSVQTKA